jgi:DTW domain-containing protein
VKLEDYKKMKGALRQSHALKIKSLRTVCPICRKSSKTCYCNLLKPFNPGPLFVIFIHPREVKNPIGTARMAHLVLRNSLLLEGIDFTDNRKVIDILNDKENFCTVLYPGSKSIKLDEMTHAEAVKLVPKDKKLVIFVIDGTWSRAKKMMKLSKNINKLPRISFTPVKKSGYSIRVEPQPQCLSTIEAIHRIIDVMDRVGLYPVKPKDAHDNLLEIFGDMVKIQLAHANNPKQDGYRRKLPKPNQKINVAKKWLGKRLFYEG